jgi:hypothetical protein
VASGGLHVFAKLDSLEFDKSSGAGKRVEKQNSPLNLLAGGRSAL